MSGLGLVLLTFAWIGGTLGFLHWALAVALCLPGCDIPERDKLVGDYLMVASTGCAVFFPALAVLISLRAHWRIAAGFFLVLGIFGLVYAMAFGTGAASDIQRRTERSPEPLTSEYAPCYSGSNDCPGG